MMIGPFPTERSRLDGGVAAATTYLSEALAEEPEVELLGVRIAGNREAAPATSSFNWPLVNLPLGRFSLSTLYRIQKRTLRRHIVDFKPDIVHGQGADLAGYLAIRSGRPCVVTVHGLLAECAKFQTNFTERIRAKLSARLTERSTIRRAEHLIAISPYVARYYRGEISGRVHHIPNAVARKFFDVVRSPESGRLLYAGRISNGKGLPELFQAMSRIRASGLQLVLAGANRDPAYGELLRSLIADLDLGNRVRFAGLLQEAELIEEFRRAAALILPSHQETAPMVIQQAMAAGLPVIATEVGGIPSQIEHGVTGLMYRPGDHVQLAAHIERLVGNEDVAAHMSRAAKGVAELRFSASSVAKATIAAYRAVLSERAYGTIR